MQVEANVRDMFMGLNQTGFSYAKIINSSVHLRFIGAPPFVFKPGMPFTGAVAVSYHDLEALSPKKLERSRLIIRVDANSPSGERIPNIIVSIAVVIVLVYQL